MSDEKKLKNYVTYHRKCSRQEKGGKVSGAYVENEIICAVAHQNDIIITVAQALQPELQVVTPDGSFMSFHDDAADRTPFFLYCTGGHYQALLKIQDFEVLSSALSSLPYINGNVLNADDIRIPQ